MNWFKRKDDSKKSVTNSSNDWSEAHLLLLSKFLNPTVPDKFYSDEFWSSVLNESPLKAIKRFLNDGYIAQANTQEILMGTMSVAELKQVLKEDGIKTSGNKNELVSRLVEFAPDVANKLSKNQTVYVCTSQGVTIANTFVIEQKQIRKDTEDKTMKLLKVGNYHEASLEHANFEKVQVFPMGIGIDWENFNPTSQVKTLKIIFSSKPKLLNNLKEDCLDELRLSAGMSFLWGTNRPKQYFEHEIDTGIHLEAETVARMFSFYASNKVSLEGYKENRESITAVQILATHDSCDECKKISGKKYSLDDVFELPYEHCTHSKGCRCIYIPVTKLFG